MTLGSSPARAKPPSAHIHVTRNRTLVLAISMSSATLALLNPLIPTVKTRHGLQGLKKMWLGRGNGWRIEDLAALQIERLGRAQREEVADVAGHVPFRFQAPGKVGEVPGLERVGLASFFANGDLAFEDVNELVPGK